MELKDILQLNPEKTREHVSRIGSNSVVSEIDFAEEHAEYCSSKSRKCFSAKKHCGKRIARRLVKYGYFRKLI